MKVQPPLARIQRAEERRAGVVRRAQRGRHADNAPCDRRAKLKGITGRATSSLTEHLIALREPGLGGLPPCLGHGGRTASIVHTNGAPAVK